MGFAGKSAAEFFELLRINRVRRVLDVRLHNTSQLAGFTKKDDLKYFLRELCNMEYFHVTELAPAPELLKAYRKPPHDWEAYASGYLRLLADRDVANQIDRKLFKDGCLLCSEERPDHCHRRLAAEYLQAHWKNIKISHL